MTCRWRSRVHSQLGVITNVKFPIAIETGTRKSAYGVVVPDLPGCFSAGDTVEEAFDNAREAIESHVEILAGEGKDLPAPKSLTEWCRGGPPPIRGSGKDQL